MQKVTCSVEALEEMADTLWYVRLKPEVPVDFLPGQYLLVVMAEDDKRPFSIANTMNDEGVLELHIGATPDNTYAMQVLKRMQDQGQIEVQLPAGKAHLREDSHHPVILMAGGTGFAYTRSILQQMLADGLRQPVFLYWGVRHEDHLYADQEMKAWAAEHKELTYVPVLQNSEHWQGRTGLVHEAIMEDFPSLSGYDVYIAGRFEMAGVAREAFKEKGIEPDQLFGDAYEFI
ncbi:NAD(P)H-flavin reductase [Oceanisphaera marina]|uniref:NAD(P)H-flavin reductase n=1 Tax=Oceanisphaera marina TaxID=2017550 RepID=A0ABQ1IK92_9GAMM|nr:NAD(P)H-flavin reductase [Oceanisphaera marina]GGB44529.1 NAD(P)H-flavin reductase [Oceanisphaera marina]